MSTPSVDSAVAPVSDSASVSLARKWRPKNFADIVGQDFVVDAVKRAARRHHAYLFSGTRGVGKTTLARILAMLLNCRDENASDPCGECPACAAIRGGGFIDVAEVDAATHTQVDKMREILDSAVYAPAQGRFRVFVIDEAHMLSRSAFNAMLKTLEEPPPHVRFILATTDPRRVPATVRSRCLCFSLSPIPREVIAARLSHVLKAEAIPFDADAANEIARLGRGSLRDALSILDQCAHGGDKLTAAHVRRVVGASSVPVLADILRAVGENNPGEALSLAGSLANDNADFGEALQACAAILFRAATAQAIPGGEDDGGEEDAAARDIAGRFSAEELQALYEVAIRGRAQLPFAPDERTGFEMTLLRMALFSPKAESDSGSVPQARGMGSVRASQGGVPSGGEKFSGGGGGVKSSTPDASPDAKVGAGGTGGGRSVQADPAVAREWSWEKLTANVSESGRALALHCREVSRDATGITLALDRSRESCRMFQGALEADLRRLCGADFELRLESAADDAAGDGRAKAAKAAVDSDPFVRGVLSKMPGATIEDVEALSPAAESRGGAAE